MDISKITLCITALLSEDKKKVNFNNATKKRAKSELQWSFSVVEFCVQARVHTHMLSLSICYLLFPFLDSSV